MIELLRKRGIRNERLLEAMRKVDRTQFVQDIFVNRSYEDSALPIGCSQTISQPYTVAFMTESLDLKGGEKILEIGTGSGYQAAVLAELKSRVFTIERHIELSNEARKRFERLKYDIASKSGDGTLGWSEFAPFDRIIVTAGAPNVPEPLLQQLKDGGLLVIPIGSMDKQNLHLIRRNGNMFETKEVQGFKFVPLIGKKGWSNS
ncbi:MAG TPA: protein-L-isoaspartate(D-aspartate) O-methyltransferase [Bacteroidota bacterium]|nr:protein-L-isoaspartate(D-aspartate) O-methyltransferase [Bacteroidota bacterium]